MHVESAGTLHDQTDHTRPDIGQQHSGRKLVETGAFDYSSTSPKYSFLRSGRRHHVALWKRNFGQRATFEVKTTPKLANLIFQYNVILLTIHTVWLAVNGFATLRYPMWHLPQSLIKDTLCHWLAIVSAHSLCKGLTSTALDLLLRTCRVFPSADFCALGVECQV